MPVVQAHERDPGLPTNGWDAVALRRVRAGHGVAAHLVVDEVTASGFELVHVVEDWPGRWPLSRSSPCAR